MKAKPRGRGREPGEALRVLRRGLDRIDARIARLLARRAALALRVAAAKKRAGLRAYDPAREAQVLTRAGRLARAPLAPEHLRAVFVEVVSATRALQTAVRVACAAGEMERAARAHFGAFAGYRVVEGGDEATLAALARGEAECAVVTVGAVIPGWATAAGQSVDGAAVLVTRRP